MSAIKIMDTKILNLLYAKQYSFSTLTICNNNIESKGIV